MNISEQEHITVVTGLKTQLSIVGKKLQEEIDKSEHQLEQVLKSRDALEISYKEKISLLEAEINRLKAELNKTNK